MKTVTNNANRRLGLPGRPALLLNPGESKTIEDSQVAEIEGNKTAAQWIKRGTVSISDAGKAKKKSAQTESKSDSSEKKDLPDGLTGEGFEPFHHGGGYYSVYVNGFEVTDSKIKKAAVEELRKDYD